MKKLTGIDIIRMEKRKENYEQNRYKLTIYMNKKRGNIN